MYKVKLMAVSVLALFVIQGLFIVFSPYGLATAPNTISVDGDMSDWAADEDMGDVYGKHLYMTWDSTSIYFGWTGSDWNNDGNLFIYLNTTAGGTRTSVDWDGTHTLPFDADYAFCLKDGTYHDLRRYDGGWLTDQPYTGQAYSGYSENPNTEISIPLADIGSPESVGVIVFAQWEINDNVWAAFPTENPASQNGHESFTHYYQVNLTSDTVPNQVPVVQGKTGVEPRPDALNLAIIWHMHQPYYKNVLTGMYELPWVRVHASQEYIDSPKILMRHPGVKVTINLVPSLVEQIEDYANNDVYDWHTYWATKGIDNLTDEEKHTMQFQFFWAPRWTYNSDWPASKYYHYLYNKTMHNLTPETIMMDTLLPENELLDLQVCWFLFQLSPWYVQGIYDPSERDDRIMELYNKYGGFTLSDLNYVLQKQKEMVGIVMDLYKEVRDAGQAEITVSPYYHPILPLLMMEDWYGESGDYVYKGVWENDTRYHLNAAADLFRQYFGDDPVGLWPSEESVSQAVIEPVADAGFQWMVSDEMVLRESGFDPDDNNVLCRPYIVSSNGKQVYMVFRDRVISDRIAWQYGKMTPKDAVDDFMDYLYNVRESLDDPANSLITVALDGENWMFMSFDDQDNGRPFLDELYSRLEQTDWIRTTTPAEFIATHPPDPAKQSIDVLARDAPNGAGSWIDGTMSTWSGEPDEDLAWERLADARQAVVDYSSQHPDTPESQKAWKAIYAAEGSDWFWWYGLDQDSGYDELWDQLFKIHLKSAYDAIGADLPPYLKNLWLTPVAPDVDGSGQVEPIIDGTELPGEWDGADIYYSDTNGTESDMDISEVAVGFDASNLYVMIKMATTNLSALIDDEDADISLYIGAADAKDMNIYGTNYVTKYGQIPLNFPGKYKVKILLNEVLSTGMTSYAVYQADGKENWLYKLDKKGDTAAIGSVIEMAIPLSTIDVEAGNEFRMKVATARVSVGDELDIVPERPMSVTIPADISPEIELMNITDPLGDETGDGDYTYPTAKDFAPGHGLWDITGLRIAATEYHLIFRLTFAEMTNVWNLRYGYSHEIVQIYIDTDRVSGSGNIDMLDGANAQVTDDFAWEVALSATGDGAYAVKDGQKTTDGVATIGDTETKTIEVSVSKKIVGTDVASYGYVIVVGSQDGFGVGKWREVDETASTWTLGGGAAPNPEDGKDYDPSIIDMVLPEGDTNQTKYLSSYDVAAKKYARLPGITIPELKQQIFGVKVKGITGSTAIVSWQTTKAAACTVHYGTDRNNLGSTAQTGEGTAHTVVLDGLEPSSTYYFRITTDDGEAESDIYFFNTTEASDTTPPMILVPNAEVVDNVTVHITWSTDEVSQGRVEWRGDGGNGTTDWSDYTKNHEATVKLPAPGVYEYRITVKDGSGNENSTSWTEISTTGDDNEGSGGETGGGETGNEGGGTKEESVSLASGNVTVAFDSYHVVKVTVPTGKVTVELSSNAPLDVIILPEDQLAYYMELLNGSVTGITTVGMASGLMSGTTEADVANGTYYVVFDYTYLPPGGSWPSVLVPAVSLSYNIRFTEGNALPETGKFNVSYAGEGNITVKADRFGYVKLNLADGEAAYVHIEVPDGKVDLLFMDSKNYERYVSGQEFEYYSVSVLSTAFADVIFSPGKAGTYYLVVDNTERPGGGVHEGRDIDAHLSMVIGSASSTTGAEKKTEPAISSGDGGDTLWYVISAVLLIAIAVLAFIYVKQSGSGGGEGNGDTEKEENSGGDDDE